jgi:hypothetical protein
MTFVDRILPCVLAALPLGCALRAEEHDASQGWRGQRVVAPPALAQVAPRPGDDFVVGHGVLAERGIELTECGEPPCRADPRTTQQDLAKGWVTITDPAGGPPRRAQVLARAITAQNIPTELVASVVRRELPNLQACLPAELAADQSRVSMTFTIDYWGWVYNVETGLPGYPVTGTTLTDDTVVRCIARAVMNMTFPRQRFSNATAGFTLRPVF